MLGPTRSEWWRPRDCLMVGYLGLPMVLLNSPQIGAPPVRSNPVASPEKRYAPKSVHMRFVGSLEEGHFYVSSFLWLM